MILSGIDIGTNSLRLLIAETGPRSLRKIHSDRRTTRLGEKLDITGKLSPAAWARSLQTLIDFRKSIGEHSVHSSVAVGTSALRKAADSSLFISDVQDRTGIAIKVISGEEEAHLTLRGVLAASGGIERGPENTIVIDIGGGSTELIALRRNSLAEETSLPLGAVYLTERFLKNDPPTFRELEMIRSEISRCLSTTDRGNGPATRLIGTAGTIMTLSSMHQNLARYDPEKINGSVLTRDAVHSIVRGLSSATLEERRRMQGLERGREDIILAGSIIALEIMDYYRIDKILVSDWGLREGIILDLYDKIVMSGTGTKTV